VSDVWGLRRATTTAPLSAARGAGHADILDDIQWMMGRLATAGLTRAYVVDLSHPAIGVPVVRVVVPGLEFTAIDEYRVGPRVRRVAARATELTL
jgi:ribosomal protein S12 methylthiotransferase accessory factor